MSNDADDLLALDCLKRGSTWQPAGLRRGQAFMVHSACAINIPMVYYKPSARNFADYRRDDERAKRFFDALMFFLHLIESAVNQVTTRTTAADRQRALAAAEGGDGAEGQPLDEQGAVNAIGHYLNRNVGGFFNAGASPVGVDVNTTIGGTVPPPPPAQGTPISNSQTERLLDDLLQDVIGDASSDGDEPAVAAPQQQQHAHGAFVYTPTPFLAQQQRAPDTTTTTNRTTTAPQPMAVVDTTTHLAPAIYILLEQVPREGQRVPREGKFYELLDMLQVGAPLFYTLHVLTCGVDMAALMARTLAINTLRMRDCPVYTAPYGEQQRVNMLMRMVMEDTGATASGGNARRGGGGGRGGRGQRGGRGRGARGRGGRQQQQRYVSSDDDDVGDDDDDDDDGNYRRGGGGGRAQSQAMSLCVSEVQKRRIPRAAFGPQARRVEPWEHYQSVTFDTIGNVYAAIFNGSSKANFFQGSNPSRALQFDLENPCHPNNMFGIAAVLLHRGEGVSYTQSLNFYVRHQQQRAAWEAQERRRQSLTTATTARPTSALLGSCTDPSVERDALDLTPRSPYVPAKPEHAAGEGRPAVYVWTPPPGAESRFLALNITEATGAALCNKALPHRQCFDSVFEDVWPGLFGKRVRRVRGNRATLAAQEDSVAEALRSAIGGDDDITEEETVYRMLPSSLRNSFAADGDDDDDDLAAFGPQVRCPVVNGQEMSIKRVDHLLQLMHQCGDSVRSAQQEVKRLDSKIEALHKDLKRSSSSRRVREERQRQHDGPHHPSNANGRGDIDNDDPGLPRTMLECGLSSSSFSFGQMDIGRYIRTGDSDSADEEGERGDGASTSTRIVLEPEDRAMSFVDNDTVRELALSDADDTDDESNDNDNNNAVRRRRRLLSQSARCANTSTGDFARRCGGEDRRNDTPPRTLDAMVLEPTSRSMPNFGSARMHIGESSSSTDSEQTAREAGLANVGRIASSEASVRAQQLRQSHVNHSDAHHVRIVSDALREQLEQLKTLRADVHLLCNDLVRTSLLHARRLYDCQVQSQTRWIKSVRLLLAARGGQNHGLPIGNSTDPNATAEVRAAHAAQHADGMSDLERAMARAPTPSPINDAIMLLRGYYAHQSTERTGQLLVDINEHQHMLWNQLNDRLVENSGNITERDARAWTIIYERSALREFEKRVNDPRANIPIALSVVFECAEHKSLHRYDGRMMHRRMDARMGVMENHMAWLLEVYNAIFCIAKCQLTLMGWISSQCATHHANDLHPGLLVMGDAAASKTFPLALLHFLRCNLGERNVRKTTIESTRETESSSSHDGRHLMDYQVTISNEMLKSVLVGDPLEGSTGSAAFKQLLDHCQSFVQTLERNPVTNAFEFHERFASYIGVRIMCANWPMAELPLPILTRVILVPCMPAAQGARNNIAQAMARRQEQGLADEKKIEEVEKYHNFLHYVQATGDAMIVCGAMKDVNLWMVSFVMTYVNQELKRRSMVTIQPRFLQHINSWVRAIVKESVYAREFNYVGGIFQRSDVTPERIQLLQPYLYADMRTVVFVLGMLTRYSSIEGDDDVRKAVRKIIETQREHVRLGLDSTRTMDGMFRIKGYARVSASSQMAQSQANVNRNNASTSSSSATSFTPHVPVDELIANDFSILNHDDSMSGMPDERSTDVFQSNFPGLRDQMMQQPPTAATRGIFGLADGNNNNHIGGTTNVQHQPFQYNSRSGANNPFNNVTIKTRDYRYITLRIGDGKNGMASRMDPRQWACSLGAQRLMAILNECGSTLTRDMVCALLMLLSEQYIKSPHYRLDSDGVPQVHSGARPENIRVVEFEAGFMHISYCWLMILDVSVTQVMREVLLKLNSYRHQPRQRCLWRHNEMFPNTFETLDIGNDDCDDERHEVLVLENPAYYSTKELGVLYSKREMQHHQAKRVMFMRVNCSLDHLAAVKRGEELRWYSGMVTERDLARVFYSAERTFGADPNSRYHNVSFDSSDMNHLDDTMCIFMPDRYYQVPNEAWSKSSPPSVSRTVAHWDILFAHEEDVEKRRRAYCDLSYFTSAAVVDDRMRRWERFVDHQYINYPEELHQRFMPRATECAANDQERESIRDLLEAELGSRRSAPMSTAEQRYIGECRSIAQDSLRILRRASMQ